MLKVNRIDIGKMSPRSGVFIVSFGHISHFFSASFVNFEQSNIGWDGGKWLKWKFNRFCIYDRELLTHF